MDNYTVGTQNIMQGSYSKGVQPIASQAKVSEHEVVPVNAKPAESTLITNKQAQQKQEQQQAKKKYEEIISDDKKMDSITDTLNKFMTQMNADIRFALHKETNFLMVKFVDVKNNKVLKEFPAEEYLDMIANIQEYIGNMIDEKV